MSSAKHLTELEAKFIRDNFQLLTLVELREQLGQITGHYRELSWLRRQADKLGIGEKVRVDRVVYDIQGPAIITD